MSLRDRIELDCHYCGTRQRVNIWHSINVTKDPALKDRFLNGEINHLKCTCCGEVTPIPIPLLYHDTDRNLWINILPGTEDEEAQAGSLCGDVEEPFDRSEYMEVPEDSLMTNLMQVIPEKADKYVVGYDLAVFIIGRMNEDELLISLRQEHPGIEDNELYPMIFDIVCRDIRKKGKGR